jgi:hypothetical protein
MHGDDRALDPIGAAIRRQCPALRIGVNYLTLPASQALSRAQFHDFDATWTDRQEFSDGRPSPEACDVLVGRNPDHLFFAAVAFKGQPDDPDPPASARLAARCGLIPTTSGPATGRAPDVAKMRAIRETMRDDDPLAIASGITPENVGEFAPFVTHILVATGISSSFYEFDGDKLARLTKEVGL